MTGYYAKRITDSTCHLLCILVMGLLLLQCGGPVIVDRDTSNRDKVINRLHSESWMERKQAAEELGAYPGSESTGALVEALDDRHGAVIIEALQSLAPRTSRKALPSIRKLARDHRSPNVRWYAIKALAEYEDALNAPIFLEGLESDDWLIRESSITGLLRIEDYSTRYVCLPAIVDMLQDPSTSVQVATMQHLSLVDDRIYEILVKKISGESKHSPAVMLAALEALMDYRLDVGTRERVVELLGHQNRKIRVMALRLLKRNKKLW